MRSPIVFLVTLGVHILRALFRTRQELLIENLALRQQVIVLKKERPRPPLDYMDRAFWVALRAAWPGWAKRLFIVNPDTVAKWHRDRFRRSWAKISHKPGRPRVDAEIRRLIRIMARDGWGAPRIHGERVKLGFVVSEIIIHRKSCGVAACGWITSPLRMARGGLSWHALVRLYSRGRVMTSDTSVPYVENISACSRLGIDRLFIVPTAAFRVLSVFIVLAYDRRRRSLQRNGTSYSAVDGATDCLSVSV